MGSPLDILSAMLGGGAAPQGVPADVPVPTSRMDAMGENGGEVQNPNAVGAPIAKSPLGNVLARLGKSRSPLAGMGGPLKISPGANKSAAFFEGMASGMKNANDAANAEATAAEKAESTKIARLKTLFDIQRAQGQDKETARRNTILESYYKGLIANGAAGKGKSEKAEKAEKPVDPAVQMRRDALAVGGHPEVKAIEAALKSERGKFNGGDQRVIADLEAQRAAKAAEVQATIDARRSGKTAEPGAAPAAPAQPKPTTPKGKVWIPDESNPEGGSWKVDNVPPDTAPQPRGRRVGMEPAPAQAPAEPATAPLPPERPAPAAAAPKDPVLEKFPGARKAGDGNYYVKTEGGWAPVVMDAPAAQAAPAPADMPM